MKTINGVEFAFRYCPAGTFMMGSPISEARRKGAFAGQTVPVGCYNPNEWGLYDMHGNVWEWCEDLFEAYSKENVTDPIGESDYPDRVIRGGWNYAASECRSETRYGVSPKERGKHLGFRGVVTIRN